MNPAELIARITAQTKSFQLTAKDFIRLTPEDVAHAMGKIHKRKELKHASLVLRVKYADQKELMRDLEIALWLAVVDMSNRNHWKYPKNRIGKEFYRKMARLAISENVNPQICPKCKGTNIRKLRGGKTTDCGPCDGTGHKFNSERERARFLGLSHMVFIYTWSERYKKVVALLA